MPAVVSGFTIIVRPDGREISYGPDRWARLIISVHLVENMGSIGAPKRLRQFATVSAARDSEPILKLVRGQSPHRLIHGVSENPGDKAVNKVRHSGMPPAPAERSCSLGKGVRRAAIPNASLAATP